MKRLLFLLIASLFLLAACGSDDKEDASKKEVNKITVELSEEKVSFLDYSIEIEKASIKDGKLTLETRFQNDSFTEPTAFMAASGVDVKQGDELLEETSGVLSDPNGNYYYKNDTGINAPVKLEYKLVNEMDDITVTFVPRDFEQESKTITVTINE